MHWCKTVWLRCISSLHSLNTLGHRLKSTSGTEPPLLLLTSDAASIKSKVALQLTASQGIDYCSTVSTVKPLEHQERDHCHRVHHMSIDTLYVIITTLVPLHMSRNYPVHWPSPPLISVLCWSVAGLASH